MSILATADENCKKTSKVVRLYLPKFCDPADFLPETLKHKADHARYLISTLYQKRFLDRRDPNQFISLHSQVLKAVIGTEYAKIREALVESGVIEMDKSYSKGEYSMGYKLCQTIREQPHITKVMEDKKMCERILKYRTKHYQGVKFDVHKYLQELQGLTKIDFDSAIKNCPEKDICQAVMIKNNDLFFHVCQYGRVHSNISSLNTDLRQFLRVNSKKLVNVDIANSQPLIFGVILMNWFKNGGKLDSFFSLDFSPKKSKFYYDFPSFDLPSFCPQITSNNPINIDINSPFSSSSFSSSSHPPPYVDNFTFLPLDVKEYLKLCQEGRLYEYLMKESQIAPEQRKEYKKTFFGRVFFCNNSHEYKEQRDFQALFPNVWKVITKLKENDYTALPKLLQKVESSLIINRVVRTAMVTIPGIWLQTIHDSVLTLPEYEKDIVAIIKSEFARINLVPTVRVDRY